MHRNLEDVFDSLHVGIPWRSVARDASRGSNQRARALLGLTLVNGEQPTLDSVLPVVVFNVCQRLMRDSGFPRGIRPGPHQGPGR